MIKRVGIKKQIENITKSIDKLSDIEAVGFDIMWQLFDAITEAQGEQEVYNFLAGPFQLTPQEVADLDLADFLDGLKLIAKENNLVGFFKFAANSMR